MFTRGLHLERTQVIEICQPQTVVKIALSCAKNLTQHLSQTPAINKKASTCEDRSFLSNVIFTRANLPKLFFQ